MGEFEKYAGLFAEKGGFDVPSNWTVGIGLSADRHVRHRGRRPADALQRDHVGRQSAAAEPDAGGRSAPTAARVSAGSDMTVVKAGFAAPAGEGLRVARRVLPRRAADCRRARCSSTSSRRASSSSTRRSGLSKDVRPRARLDLAVTRAFDKTVSGPNPLEAPGRQTINLSMNQWVVTVGYTLNFR